MWHPFEFVVLNTFKLVLGPGAGGLRIIHSNNFRWAIAFLIQLFIGWISCSFAVAPAEQACIPLILEPLVVLSPWVGRLTHTAAQTTGTALVFVGGAWNITTAASVGVAKALDCSWSSQEFECGSRAATRAMCEGTGRRGDGWLDWAGCRMTLTRALALERALAEDGVESGEQLAFPVTLFRLI
jgi:hypothetical protein